MATQVIRFQNPASGTKEAWWGVAFGNRVAVVPGNYATTRDFVQRGLSAARALTPTDCTLALGALHILSPVTTNQQFVCQGLNYESHARESGLDPKNLPFITFFTKASSCINGPYDDVYRPRHVALLDYEIELGLVMKADVTSECTLSEDSLHEVLAGLTIVNDVSARDIQLPQGQFYKGKSYRTFGPVGPFLLLLEPHEWKRWPELRMRLSVNGTVRQEALCAEMLKKPHETLTELSGMHDLNAGDLVATGTPHGCAAKAPGKVPMFIAQHFLSEQLKWKLFIQQGSKNPLYLQPKDVMDLTISTDDGILDLGAQHSRVVQA